MRYAIAPVNVSRLRLRSSKSGHLFIAPADGSRIKDNSGRSYPDLSDLTDRPLLRQTLDKEYRAFYIFGGQFSWTPIVNSTY